MGEKQIPHDPRHIVVPSGASKMIFGAYGTFGANCAIILRQDSHYLQIDRIELPLESRHLEVPLGASK